MKTEKFQLHGNNSLCAAAFQLLRGRAPAQLRGNIVLVFLSILFYFIYQNSNALVFSQFQWLISAERKITQNM
jgi:hypothetical protein